MVLAVTIGEKADELRGNERREPAAEVQQRQLAFGHPDVGHHRRRDEGNDRKAGKHQRDRERKGAQMIALAEDGAELPQRPAPPVAGEMRRERRHEPRGAERHEQ